MTRKQAQKQIEKMVLRMLAACVMDKRTERLIDAALNPPSETALKIQKWEDNFFADYLTENRYAATSNDVALYIAKRRAALYGPPPSSCSRQPKRALKAHWAAKSSLCEPHGSPPHGRFAR
jgi:hypothetical protein